MKISINCKLDSAGAYGFIKPISAINDIKMIDVFRDSDALACEKVRYHNSINNRNGILGQLSKLFKMLTTINKQYKLSIGIYEVPHGLLAFLIGKLYHIPTVISIIGNPAYSKLRKGIRKKITYFMYRRIHAVTVTGSKSKQVVVNNGIREDKIYILPNSIDIEKFSPDSSVIKKYDLISLGRLSEEKELGNLLEIVSLLKKSKLDIKVGIAGKGPETESLKKLIVKKNLSLNVDLLGYVDDITDFYRSGKLFTLTSRTEGLPRTIVEAMACGIPCIASNVGDMEDVIDDGLNGYLIQDYKDIDKFIEMINFLLKNKKEYDEMTEQSIKKIKICFSYKAATKVWENILSKIGDK
jgi:glycosyltransferase involved in cell wall biosynthesis